MIKNVLYLLFLFVLLACQSEREKADLILYNARIYSVDSSFQIVEAMAIKAGKIIGTGNTESILANFDALEKKDVRGKSIFPGFIDAHCHFLGYGLGLAKVDLVGTQSFDQVLQRVQASSTKKNSTIEQTGATISNQSQDKSWIVGRGWDQNDWENKQMPDRTKLDQLFPDRPVYLTRIDGHAILVNGAALKLANITAKTKISGGEILLKNGAPSGVLVDNAIDLVKSVLPQPSKAEKIEALLNAQANCLAMGLCTIDEAGLMYEDIALIDQLHKENKLKMRVYAMLSDSAPNYEHYLNAGPYKTDRLTVRSFKYYVDGALGSRGACLYEDYADKKNWKGFLLNTPAHFEQYAKLLSDKGFQMNAHCIGDSAFGLMVNIYSKYCKGDGTKRWRIEHAQITAKKDLDFVNGDIIPSVQPTHATSDMYWAAERLGKERVQTAYAYLDLLAAAGTLPLGTDFPVEDLSPFKTFYAAVFRQDAKGFPEKGFQTENALSREQTLRGMTIWAAYANFEEKEKGSLEKGKFADFIILDTDLMTSKPAQILTAKVLTTYINGEKVQ